MVEWNNALKPTALCINSTPLHYWTKTSRTTVVSEYRARQVLGFTSQIESLFGLMLICNLLRCTLGCNL